MNITWEVVAAGITVLGFVSGIWWRVEGMIRKNTDDLAAHKLHAAETFVSKAGLREVEGRIMDAINAVGSQVSGMSGRIDRLMERPATSTRRANP